MKIILPFAIISLIFTGIIFSDAGYYDLLYRPINTSQGEHPTIIMESENVIIEPDYNGAKIDAEFVFYNDGPATEVTMFFPISEMMNAVGNLLDLYSPTDKEFIDAIKKLGVDERILKEKEIVDVINGNDAGFIVKVNNIDIPVDYITEDKLDENYTLTENKFTRWTVNFTGEEKKTITCSFNADYYMQKLGYGTPVISYILSSGSGWKGPIGKGTITIHRSLSKFNVPLFFISPTAEFYPDNIDDTTWGYFTELTSIGDIPPAEVSVSDDIEEITWRFSNYEPDSKTVLMIYVGIIQENMIENTFEINELFSALGLERSKFFPGITLEDGQNFRKEPSISADPASGRPQLNKGEIFNIIGARGEWWNIELKDGTEGWIRWRFVDPDTGELYIHASLTGIWKPDE
jgi:hypothetical protein